MPPLLQGLHRSTRQIVSAVPITAPWTRKALTAYALQVG